MDCLKVCRNANIYTRELTSKFCLTRATINQLIWVLSRATINQHVYCINWWINIGSNLMRTARLHQNKTYNKCNSCFFFWIQIKDRSCDSKKKKSKQRQVFNVHQLCEYSHFQLLKSRFEFCNLYLINTREKKTNIGWKQTMELTWGPGQTRT